MGAFIDARCPKCKKRIGWFGKMTDMPNCPRCGTEPDRKALAEDEAKMEEFQRLLALRSNNCSGADLRKQRNAAGLTLVPVAEHLGVTCAVVSGWERGEGKPTEEQAAILDKLYGGD
jgi:DNA-binding transcriptional regulator YiaG